MQWIDVQGMYMWIMLLSSMRVDVRGTQYCVSTEYTIHSVMVCAIDSCAVSTGFTMHVLRDWQLLVNDPSAIEYLISMDGLWIVIVMEHVLWSMCCVIGHAECMRCRKLSMFVSVCVFKYVCNRACAVGIFN